MPEAHQDIRSEERRIAALRELRRRVWLLRLRQDPKGTLIRLPTRRDRGEVLIADAGLVDAGHVPGVPKRLLCVRGLVAAPRARIRAVLGAPRVRARLWRLSRHRSTFPDGAAQDGAFGPAQAEELLRTALGVRSVDEASGEQLSRIARQPRLTPYLANCAISLGMSQRLPSLTDQERIAVDDELDRITSSLAKCEKLLRTPIPLGYTRYSVRFLWVWLSLLPFALVRTFNDFGANTWWEDKPQPVLTVAMLFIGFVFLSIEDIAVQIEEPFAILPLETHQRWLLRDAEQVTSLMQWAKQYGFKKRHLGEAAEARAPGR